MTFWRRFTQGYATLLSWLLALSVAILVIPVSLQIFSNQSAPQPSIPAVNPRPGRCRR